jgi:hypothetical protein
MSLPTNLLKNACCIGLTLLSASYALGQVSRPAVRSRATASPIEPDRVSGQGSLDHSSMSPDSWSAPITGPIDSRSNGLVPRNLGGPNGPGSNQIVPLNNKPAGNNNQFEPFLFASPKTPSAPTVKNYRQPDLPTPSIPELQLGNQQRAGNSILREPQRNAVPAVLASENRRENGSPFRSAKFRQSDQGPILNGPLGISPNQQPMLPGEIKVGIGEAAQKPQQSPAVNAPLILNEQSTLEFSIPDSNGLAPQAPANRQRHPFAGNRNLSPQSQSTVSDSAPRSAITPDGGTSVPVQQNLYGYPSGDSLPPAGQSIFSSSPPTANLPIFRPDLGHRMPGPTFRGRDHDSGQKFDFEEKKKDYPPFSEILATGRYFGSASMLFLQPIFQRNGGVTGFNSAPATATFANTEAFDFDYETAPRFRLGFESKYGPGIELDYWQFDQGSNVSAFTSNGTTSGELRTGIFGPGQTTALSAINAGETIAAIHSIDIESFGAMFFKEVQFPVSRMNGMFGLHYVSIFQTLDAQLTDAGGSLLGELRSNSDLRAYGPKFKFEYYRPIGHTKFEFVTAFGGGILFGERDQFVTNTQTNISTRRVGADEYVLTSEFYSGVQFKKMFAEKRGVFGRVGFNYQSWIGGGTAINAEDNFGLRGFILEVGYNR